MLVTNVTTKLSSGKFSRQSGSGLCAQLTEEDVQVLMTRTGWRGVNLKGTRVLGESWPAWSVSRGGGDLPPVTPVPSSALLLGFVGGDAGVGHYQGRGESPRPFPQPLLPTPSTANGGGWGGCAGIENTAPSIHHTLGDRTHSVNSQLARAACVFRNLHPSSSL